MYRRVSDGTAGRKMPKAGLKQAALAALFTAVLFQYSPAELATQEQMDNVCRNWLTAMVHRAGTWAGSGSPEVVEVGPFFSGDTLVGYYYNIAPDGFVVVPVLKEMRPVKAYSEYGRFDPTLQAGQVQLLREVLHSRQDLYRTIYGDLDKAQPEVGDVLFDRTQRAAWSRLEVSPREFRIDQSLSAPEEKGPLTTTSWHQEEPYNNLCPMGDGGRCVVGCTATAAAQILAYWQWPPHGRGSNSYYWSGDLSCQGFTPGGELSADFSDAYDWANIPDNCDSGCTSQQEAALAELSFEVGVAFDMQYGYCASGAWPEDAIEIFPGNFCYYPGIERRNREDYSLGEWFSMIQAEIDADRVISYCIFRHAIVCDGWRDQGQGWYEYHMNYGWGGNQSLWYVLDNLYCSWVEGDICPPWEDYMLTGISPRTLPQLEYSRHAVTETYGDGDGFTEAGETAEMIVTVANKGWDAGVTFGRIATPDEFVTIVLDSVGFPEGIEWGGEGSCLEPFVFEISPSCPSPHMVVFSLETSSDGVIGGSDPFFVFIGDQSGFEDDMEGGTGYWVETSLTEGFDEDWHLSKVRCHSDSVSWRAGRNEGAPESYQADGGLITPPFLIPPNAELSFWHWINARTYKDGGLVYISVDGAAWEILIPEGGYPRYISDSGGNPLEDGTPCYSGLVDWNRAVFDLSEQNGMAQIMFRYATDGWVETEGWYIDDVEVYTGRCCGMYTGGQTGNCNCDEEGRTTLSDISRLIDHLYISKEPLCCPENGNTNGDPGGDITLSDITRLIDHVYVSRLPCASCQ